MEISRRDLFTFLSFSKDEKEREKIRPPYCDDISLFQSYCTECDLKPCVDICEQEIIRIDKDGVPYLVFDERGCTFCGECANVCKEEFLKNSSPNMLAKVEIDILKCLSWNKTMCFSCKEPCLYDAINFIGMFRPMLDESKCTRCGYCIGVCPTQAITIKGVEI